MKDDTGGRGQESGDAVAAREAARDSLMLTAGFRLKDGRKSEIVRVRNLSAGGLMAEVAMPLPTGTAVEINLRGIGDVTGTVVWSMEGRVGIALDQTIDPMKARKPVGVGTHTPEFAKPILPIR